MKKGGACTGRGYTVFWVLAVEAVMVQAEI